MMVLKRGEPMPEILIVEDDEPISDLIQMHLSIAGYGTHQVFDAEGALDFLGGNTTDLILLDIMLPGMSGFELLEKLLPKGIPVIFLTAKRELPDKVKGLKMGAEDYIVKPFEPIELIARIEVVLRRTGQKGFRLVFEDVEIDEDCREVFKAGRSVELTLREYELLCMLVRYQRHALSRDKLLDGVWGFDYPGGTRTVDMHINRLRNKLGWQDKIRTVYKIGYRLEH
jgi:two-component system alkaline phosphatase synthesis response regulator PhoP